MKIIVLAGGLSPERDVSLISEQESVNTTRKWASGLSAGRLFWTTL